MMANTCALMLVCISRAASDGAQQPSKPSRLSQYTILLHSNATKEECDAAQILRDETALVAGTRLPILHVGSSAPVQNVLAVGFNAASELSEAGVLPASALDNLGTEGSLVYGFGPENSPSYLITGGHGALRGTIYGVYRFLEAALGLRFLTPNVTTTTVWSKQSDPKLPGHMFRNITSDGSSNHSCRFVPVLEMRDMNNAQSEGLGNEPWAVAVADNGEEFGENERKSGGGVRYASPPGAVHTAYVLVPPSNFSQSHPEWYGGSGQLCWLAPGLKEFLVQEVRSILRGQPNVSIVSVSQNDNQDYCKVGPDLISMQEERSPAAPMLRCINFIADGIKDEYPHVAVDTLAYQYTRPAPNKTKPRDNVIVRLCSIECNFAQPLTHSSNAAFANDLKSWGRISNRLYIWDYSVDFQNWLMPWPNYYTLAPNIRFFVQHGVAGVFEEGNYKSYGGDLEAMKSYIICKLLFDPSLDETVVMNDFLDGFYGIVGAETVRSYMQALRAAATQTSTYLSITLGYRLKGKGPLCHGNPCPAPTNPGDGVCSATPIGQCWSGCSFTGKCGGRKPGLGKSCNECQCNARNVPCCHETAQQLEATMYRASRRGDPYNCSGYSPGGDNPYLTPQLTMEIVRNFTVVLQQVNEHPYHQRLELQSLGGLYVLLLRWDEMMDYTSTSGISWPLDSTDKATVLAHFARIYRKNGLDNGVSPVSFGADWGLNEGTSPPQLACFEKNVMNGTCVI